MAATLTTAPSSSAPPPVDFFATAADLTTPPPFLPLSSKPRVLDTYLLLTAREALSHHDPAMQDKSNGQLFHRVKHLLPALPEEDVSPKVVQALCRAHPVPGDIAHLFQGLSVAEFAATCFVRAFIDLYNGWNGGEGAGLFSGQERYERLEQRLRQAATTTFSLRRLWDALTHRLQTPLAAGASDRDLLGLFALPPALQRATLRACQAGTQSAVMLARTWHGEAKAQSAAYADKAKRPPPRLPAERLPDALRRPQRAVRGFVRPGTRASRSRRPAGLEWRCGAGVRPGARQ